LEYVELSAEYSGNTFTNWILSGCVYVLVLSVLLFNYISTIPDFITDNINFYGYSLNNFGFIFVVYSLFYIVKSVFSRIFFIFTGNKKRWKSHVFTTNKFFYFVTLLICLLIIIYYFYQIDQYSFFKLCTVFFILIFIVKIIFLITSSNKALPKKWYHKFLYICTLQILPHFAVWWFLFSKYYR